MHMQIVSLFPDMLDAVIDFGVVSRAVDRGLLQLGTQNPRDFADDAHRTVDDRPYGGGPGMVMKFAPLARAIDNAQAALPAGCPVIALTPQGRVFDQDLARYYASLPGLTLLAGRYEGIDERLIEAKVDEELSLGDFVLSGGEIAAMAVIDAVTRLLPGVLGDESSAAEDSFMSGLLDYPHYTRPEEIDGRRVPDELLSGDHARIARWRQQQALGRTYVRRADLLARMTLSSEQQALLDEFLQQQDASGN
ncbi:MAG: tRNA (guanosine(37)-N1)-methyltransferase TrmD [Woeseia sp.]|nr:tRNA (guanosine(37)-N1)-methyltransferase TrmD [Woeseia sp.]